MLRKWISRRASRKGLDGHAHISRQRRTALWLTVFSAARTSAWIVCMLVICVHWLGVGGPLMRSFISMSSSVLFVTFISFYCNAATDAANLMAGIAALFSADSHHDAEAARVSLGTDLGALEADVARLAGLQPGAEAAALAEGIRRKLAGEPAGEEGKQ